MGWFDEIFCNGPDFTAFYSSETRLVTKNFIKSTQDWNFIYQTHKNFEARTLHVSGYVVKEITKPTESAVLCEPRKALVLRKNSAFFGAYHVFRIYPPDSLLKIKTNFSRERKNRRKVDFWQEWSKLKIFWPYNRYQWNKSDPLIQVWLYLVKVK